MGINKNQGFLRDAVTYGGDPRINFYLTPHVPSSNHIPKSRVGQNTGRVWLYAYDVM